MRDDEIAVAQKGRGEGRLRRRAAVQHRRQRLDAAPGPVVAGDVDIVGARLLERQADEFAAPLNAGPVEELVGHESLRRWRPFPGKREKQLLYAARASLAPHG